MLISLAYVLLFVHQVSDNVYIRELVQEGKHRLLLVRHQTSIYTCRLIWDPDVISEDGMTSMAAVQTSARRS